MFSIKLQIDISLLSDKSNIERDNCKRLAVNWVKNKAKVPGPDQSIIGGKFVDRALITVLIGDTHLKMWKT